MGEWQVNVVYGSALLRALMGKAGVAAVGSAARLGPFTYRQAEQFICPPLLSMRVAWKRVVYFNCEQLEGNITP